MVGPQFSLRTLLAVLGLLSICFALLAMRAFTVLLLAVVIVALVAVRHGIAKRRIHFVMIGMITAIVAGVLLLYDLSFGHYWTGYVTLNCDVPIAAETGRRAGRPNFGVDKSRVIVYICTQSRMDDLPAFHCLKDDDAACFSAR